MLIMSIGELANLPKQKREVEQKTNKLLILCVELILLSYFFQQRKLLLAGVYQHLVTALYVAVAQYRRSNNILKNWHSVHFLIVLASCKLYTTQLSSKLN